MSDPIPAPDPKAEPAPAPAAKDVATEPEKPATETAPELSPEAKKLAKLQEKLEAAQAKLKEHEDAKLSDQEKAAKELAATRAELAKARTEKALLSAGVPEDLHGFLAVPEGMKPEKFADGVAKALAAHVKAQAPVPRKDVGAQINPQSPPQGKDQSQAAQGQPNSYMALVKRRTA